LPTPGSYRGQSSDARGSLDSEKPETRNVDPASSPPDSTKRQNGVSSDGAGAGNPDVPANGGANEPPDVSPEFQSEMAAVRAHYGAKIAAARRSLRPGDLAVAIRALLDEETVALRAVADRWRAATERQKQGTPQRPTGKLQQRKDNPPTLQ
jgi:hypothetical protein